MKKKMLFNIFWFITPILILGCLDGSFTKKIDNIFVSEGVKTRLDTKSLAIVNKYGATIRKYSEKYGIDWRLAVAVMKVESQFNHRAESHKGAKGLMQIMPATQEEIAEKMGIGSSVIDGPHGNIRGGIFYLAKLYRLYGNQGIDEQNQLKLTLAAYNAGLGRIYDAQKMAEYVNDNPREWKSIKNSLSLLSRKYSSLHKFVWEEKKPTNGYFSGWKQTANYVESVIAQYEDYKKAFDSET